MATSKKPRKRHKPKQISRDPINRILLGNSPVSSQRDILNKHKLIQLKSFWALRDGKATKTDINELIDLVNLAETFQGNGVGSEYASIVASARNAIRDICARYEKIGRFTPRGEHISVFHELMELYDEQLKIVTLKQAEDITSKIEAFHRSGKGGIKIEGLGSYIAQDS